MNDAKRHKFGSAISLFALIINLIPFHALPAQAAEKDYGEPASHAHRRPATALVETPAALSAVGSEAEALLPGWFSASAPTSIDYTNTAGLRLSEPAFVDFDEAERESLTPYIPYTPYHDSRPGDDPQNTNLPPSRQDYKVSNINHHADIEKVSIIASSPPTATIGSVITYVLTITEPVTNTTLSDVKITDTLDSRLTPFGTPATGGVPGNAAISGGTITATFPVITAGEQAVVTFTAYVNENANEGDVITNVARMSHSTAAAIDSNTVETSVLEPLAHLGKSYVTADGCEGTLVQDNFNDDTLGNWVDDGSGEPSIVEGTLVLTDSSDVAIQGNPVMTDFSISFMARLNPDHSGELTVYIRRQRPSTNAYLFVWDGSTAEFVNDYGTTPLASAPVTDTGNWRHFEIRVVGYRFLAYVDGQLILDATDTEYISGQTELRTIGNGTDVSIDDVLITKLGETGCLVNANERITYTLTVSNHGQIPAHDLVITDALPAGMTLADYTFTAPAGTSLTGPANTTGDLTWTFDQLTPTIGGTYDPTVNPAIVLTVVLTTPNSSTSLANQAFLSYDGQPGSGPNPDGVQRSYSGGSHSTGVQNVNITKTLAVSPAFGSVLSSPLTVTLGSLVTYTLKVPGNPISTTLNNVVITDQLNTPLFYIEDVAVTPTGNTGFSRTTGLITATIPQIPADTQTLITVTARISYEFPLTNSFPISGNVITNNFKMSHDATAGEIRSNVVTVTVAEPAITLTKVVESSTGSLTDLDGSATLTYVIHITNNGSSPAYSINISDTLPAGITVTNPYSGKLLSGNIISWTIPSLSHIAPTNTTTVSYTARITGAPAAAALTNTVEVLYHSLTRTITGVRPYTGNTSAVITTGRIRAAKSVQRISSSTDNLRIGDIITYTVVVTVPAATVIYYPQLVDALPPGFRYAGTMNVTGGDQSGSVTTGTLNNGINQQEVITWKLNSLTNTNQTEVDVISSVFAVQITGETPLPDSSEAPPRSDQPNSVEAVNVVTVAWNITDTGNFDPAIALTETSAITSYVGQPELVISKSSDPPSGQTVDAGQPIIYNLTITNSGYATAHNVIVTDTLSAGLSYQTTISTPTGAITTERDGQAITYTISQIDAGPNSTLVLTVEARVSGDITAGLRLTNTAALSAYNSQPDDTGRVYTNGNSSSVYHMTMQPSITKSVDPATATLGSVITYVIAVPAPPITANLYAVTITDRLDSRLDLQTVETNGGITSTNGNTLVVTYTTIASNTQQFITVTAVISSDLPINDGDVITNQAVMTHSTGSTVSNRTVVTVSVSRIETAKAVTPASSSNNNLRIGDEVTYTTLLTISPGVRIYYPQLVDTLPPGFRYIAGTLAVTPGQDIDSGTLSPPVTTGTLGSGIDQQEVITWNLNSLTNTNQTEPGLITTTFIVQITGETPDGVETMSEQTASFTGENNFTAYWNIADDNSFNPSTALSETSVITSYVGQPELVIGKSSNPPRGQAVAAGQLITYSLTITNNGHTPAYNVIVSDTLPAGVAYQSSDIEPATTPFTPDDSLSADGLITWQIGVIGGLDSVWVEAGQVVTITVVAQVDAAITAGLRLTNTAALSAYNSQPDDTGRVYTNGNSSSVYHLTGSPALSLTKTAGPAGVTAGERLTYTIRITNNGDSTATGVVVTDTLPASVTVVSATPDATPINDGLTWSLSSLNAGDPVTLITMVVTVNAAYTGTIITNKAEVAGNENISDTDTVTTPVESRADVTIAKLNDPTQTVLLNQPITYTLRFTNNGPSDAQNVVISDTLPDGVSFGAIVNEDSPFTDNSSQVGQVISWTASSLAANATGELLFTVIVSNDTTGILTNSVSITSPTDVITTNNRSTVTNTIQSGTDILITKLNNPSDVVIAGQPITYTLLFTNIGPNDAQNVVISDTLPNGVSFGTIVSEDSPFTGSSNQVGQVISWAASSLTASLSGELVFTVIVSNDTTGIVTNTVAITSPTDVITTNNDASVTNTITTLVDLEIVKTSQPEAGVAVGAPLTYVLAYTNNGPNIAEDVVITDELPANVTLIGPAAATPAINGPTEPVAGTLVWTTPTMAVGDSGRITFTVRVADNATGDLVNNVQITNRITETTTDNNTDTVTNQVLLPGIIVDKLVNVSTNVVSATVIYTLKLTNSGQITFTRLHFNDTLPDGLVYAGALAGQPVPSVSADRRQLLWEIDQTLPPGDNYQVQFNASISLPQGVTGTYINVVTGTGFYTDGNISDTGNALLVVADPAVAITKTFVATNNGQVTFNIRIRNTGPSTLNSIPLFDYFFGPIVYAGGTPEADQVLPGDNSGELRWLDLTNSFGQNLQPGETFLITTIFDIVTDAQEIDIDNTAIVDQAGDIFANETNLARSNWISDTLATAVDLLYFRGKAQSESIALEWATAAEINNFAFQLLRSTTGRFEDATQITFIPVNGQNGSGATYNFVDLNIRPDQTYTYWLVDIDTNGIRTNHGPVSITTGDTILYLPLIVKEK